MDREAPAAVMVDLPELLHEMRDIDLEVILLVRRGPWHVEHSAEPEGPRQTAEDLRALTRPGQN